ncbi:hypothetical protein Pyn_24952 [Prunus yedoensis var. nudiflora]|uniref:Uncharacterized protein n=1 Tax=Prunus yedoensis var. nudiflora TaxID=2094558 RepID=A0A314U7M4_PRUYE|nr:hypothetical protein Pyn_24952 [Prunus yedoensis var. nudiflora]
MSMTVVLTSCKANARVVGDKVALQATSGVVSTTLQLDNMEETLKLKRSNKIENTDSGGCHGSSQSYL